MIQITDKISWDEKKPYYMQNPETTELLNETISGEPLIEQTEDCPNGYRRVIMRTWRFGDSAILKQVNTYMEPANSPRWGALADSTFMVTRNSVTL